MSINEISTLGSGTSSTVIAAEGIGKTFGELQVLKDVSLPVRRGEVVCVVGPSGSGKTTLAGKLAYWLKSEGHSPLLVAADLQRPNAVTQLQVVGQRAGVPVFAADIKGDLSGLAAAGAILLALALPFAVGFTFLAMIYNREYQLDYPAHPGDPSPLDRALKAVRQAIAQQPEDSRAYLALMIVQFNRRELGAALSAGKRSIALNKYDMLALGEYGGRLILSGRIEKGMALLQEAGGGEAARPAWHHIYLFVGSYVSGDMAEAMRHAADIPNDNVAMGQVAQVLAASAAGKAEETKKAVERLNALNSNWVSNPQKELSRVIPDRGIVERLAKGLAAAGVPGGS